MVERRAGGNFGLQDKIPFTVHTTAIQVATVLASGVHLKRDMHTHTNTVFMHAAEKQFSPFEMYQSKQLKTKYH